jgi:hypothetical protein
MFIYGIPDGLSHEDVAAQIRAMQCKSMELESQAGGLREGARDLARELVLDILTDAGIKEGDRCTVEFSDGTEDVLFEGISHGHVVVRHFTKKGKPCKHASSYSYTLAYLFSKSNVGNEARL